MEVDLRVMMSAREMPSLLTERGPIVKISIPGILKGKKIHNRKRKKKRILRLFKIRIIESLATTMSISERLSTTPPTMSLSASAMTNA
jgi:hypothetical protein